MQAAKELILRKVAGENILIPTGKMSLKIHGMVSLTESGALLWQQLQNGCGKEELVNALLAEYEVDRQTAEADVSSFLERMEKLGLVEHGDASENE